MKKLWLALGTVLALTIGVVLAEGTNDKTKTECGKDGQTSCCCCAKSCPK